MEIKRNLETKQVYITNDEQILLETNHIGAEFIISISTDNPIIITKELDEYLYLNLKQILENKYLFNNNNLSYQKDNIIVWFSDQYCDIEDIDQTDKINRLVIKQEENQIQISIINPFYKKYNIQKKYNVIAFSPCGNGFYSKNIETRMTFQDDIIDVFHKTLIYQYNDKKVLNKKRKR